MTDGADHGRPGQRGRGARARPASDSAATDATITDVLPLHGTARPRDLPRRRAEARCRAQPQGGRSANVAEPLGVAPRRRPAPDGGGLARPASRTCALRADAVTAGHGDRGVRRRRPDDRVRRGRRARWASTGCSCPRTAAVFSAFGIGFSDISQHYEAADSTAPDDDRRGSPSRCANGRERDMFAEGVELDGLRGDLPARAQPRRGRSSSNCADSAPTPLERAEPGRRLARAVARRPAAARRDRRCGSDGAERGGHGQPLGPRPHRRRPSSRSTRCVDQPPGDAPTGPRSSRRPFFTMRLPEGWRFRDRRRPATCCSPTTGAA